MSNQAEPSFGLNSALDLIFLENFWPKQSSPKGRVVPTGGQLLRTYMLRDYQIIRGVFEDNPLFAYSSQTG